MKLTILFLLISISVNAQVYIPDNIFKLQLLWHTEINTNSDVEISFEEAENYTGSIIVPNKEIEDLTGIEAFISLTELNCIGNELTSLDVSDNVNLLALKADNNNITELDVSNNVLIETLTLGGNSIDRLDLSNNTMLTFFSGYNNDMKFLDMRNGNNENLTFGVTLNPELCMSVDNVDYSVDNWGGLKDATATFSSNCTLSIQELKPLKRSEITAIYDMQGRKVQAIKSGIYIIKTKDGRTLKVHK